MLIVYRYIEKNKILMNKNVSTKSKEIYYW